MPLTPSAQPQQRGLFAANPPRLAYASLWTFENGTMPRTLHRHSDTCEVLLTVEGNGVHTVGGRTYRTGRGDLLVYNSGVVHEDNSNPGSLVRIYCCGVENLRLPGLPVNCLLPRDAGVCLRTGARFSDFETVFRLIYERTVQPRTHDEEIVSCLLQALLLLITQLESGGEEGEGGLASSQVSLMRGYIDTHYDEDISLDQIAAQAHISSYYASRLFKEQCGYAPMQYVMRRRIGEAQSLLLTTTRTVADIAAQTGFDSPNHFSTIFNKHVGFSPSAYRKAFRRERQEE